ncbi:hypothetical protein SEA_FIZZLES_27 [Microbacterium phage Fizzles]|nr:hypothetical protein SEA_FIZZLES_27 [Microbacterium phage Fizzles]
MSPARIPEGSVFVARQRGENVAAQLLEAAEQVGADRALSVRTVSGGYHVFEEVAEQYQANLGQAPDETEDESNGDQSDGDEGTGDEGTGDQSTGDQGAGDEGNGDQSNGDQNVELEPLPVSESNSRSEIDAYGAELDPPVDTTKAANKADAIKLLEDARKPQTPAAE